jgi:hypothetical protein
MKGRGKSSAVVGALISSVRDSCRAGMLDWSPRIKLAMYTCDIQASTDVLGKVYGVVARRRGRIVSEEMKEGTSFFTIRSMMPVVESFGFADGTSPHSYLCNKNNWLMNRNPKANLRSCIPSIDFLRVRNSRNGSILGPNYCRRIGRSGRKSR